MVAGLPKSRHLSIVFERFCSVPGNQGDARPPRRCRGLVRVVKLPGVGAVLAPEPEHPVLLLRRTRRRITLQVQPRAGGRGGWHRRVWLVPQGRWTAPVLCSAVPRRQSAMSAPASGLKYTDYLVPDCCLFLARLYVIAPLAVGARVLPCQFGPILDSLFWQASFMP